MARTRNQEQDSERIRVQCPCGKTLSAQSQHAGKKVKCPACGQIIVVSASSLSPAMAETNSTDEIEGLSKNTLILLWSLVGVFVATCVLLLFWYSSSSHQAQVVAANERTSLAIDAANEWLNGNSLIDGDSVERELSDALEDEATTEKRDGESILAKVKQRREQLEEEARSRRGERQAATMWSNAKLYIDGNRVNEAITLLRAYVDDPHATERANAQKLLAEAENAISDDLVLEALIALSDEDFNQMKSNGNIQDGQVTHPVLVALRSETVKRNLQKAVQGRAEIRIAEEKRRESERLAAIRLKNQEAELRRKAEQARMEQVQLRKAEVAAKLSEYLNPQTVSFKDLTNFPEDYVQKKISVKSVWLHGGLERDKDAGVFCVDVSSEDGRYAMSSRVTGDDLIFVVSESFGRALDLSFMYDTKVATNLYFEISKIEKTPVARIYRIETLNLAGNVLNTLEDQELFGVASTSEEPHKLTNSNKGTKGEPILVGFKDLANFPEDYSESFVKIESLWLHGDLDRDKDAGVFCVGVSSEDGKYANGSQVYGDDLIFIVSEPFGRVLDLRFEGDKKVATNLYCKISKIDKTPVAKIYRIETLNLAGNVLDTYEDK